MSKIFQIILVFTVSVLVCACGGGSGGSGAVGENPEEDGLDLGDAFDDGADDTGSAGARLLIEEDFSGGQFNPLWSQTKVDNDIYIPSGQSPFAQMQGQGDVLHYYIPIGVNEITPVQVGVQGSGAFEQVSGKEEVEEFFIEWKEFYPDNHDFANGSQKMMRVTYWKLNEPRGTEVNWWVQWNNGNLQLFIHHPQGIHGEVENVTVNLEQGIPTGRWVVFAVWCKLNTPEHADGFVRVYINQRRIISKSDLNLRGNDSRGWNQMWIGGNHTNSGPTTNASSRYIDDIRWYDTKPLS